MKALGSVDVYADLLGGRAEYETTSVQDLLFQINRNLRRQVNWDIYDIYVNDIPAYDKHLQLLDGDVVKIVSPLIKGLGTPPVRRPFLNPLLRRPDFAVQTEGRMFVGTFSCKFCNGPLLKENQECPYCGRGIDWRMLVA